MKSLKTISNTRTIIPKINRNLFNIKLPSITIPNNDIDNEEEKHFMKNMCKRKIKLKLDKKIQKKVNESENKHPKENWEDVKFTYEKQIEDNAEAAKEQREKMKNK